jgi:hypothetical protein
MKYAAMVFVVCVSAAAFWYARISVYPVHSEGTRFVIVDRLFGTVHLCFGDDCGAVPVVLPPQ